MLFSFEPANSTMPKFGFSHTFPSRDVARHSHIGGTGYPSGACTHSDLSELKLEQL